MAPVTAETLLNVLVKRRQCYYDNFGRVRCYSNGWYNWGRWVVLAIILFIFLLFVCCACLTSRRRRARGAKPMYGTGWMSQGPLAPPPYSNNAPPQYNQQPPQNYGGSYGVQHPKPTHQGAAGEYYNSSNNYEMGYQAPNGPPPPTNQYR